MLDIIIRNITQRKFRTGLTVFGIALGIFAVMTMGGMSEYFRLHIDRTLSLADKIQVMPEAGFFGGALNESIVSKVRHVPGVADAYGMLVVPLDMENMGLFGGDFVYGIQPEKQELTVKDTKLTGGRYLVPGDRYKAVIGNNVAREFKLKVGDELEIKSKRVARATSITHTRNFTVVGIMEFTGSDYDYIVGIPLDTAQDFYDLKDMVTYIWVVPYSGTDTEDLSKRIELSVENVKAISPQQLRKQAEQMLIVISLITISSAVLATIIGGLSVMNTMFMSVSERTREFGLMKALGAEVKDILVITMGEAALLGILGGIIGIAGGGLFVYYLNEYLASRGTVLFEVTPRLVGVSLLFATSLGILSGGFPALRAARMSPMEALRYE